VWEHFSIVIVESIIFLSRDYYAVHWLKIFECRLLKNYVFVGKLRHLLIIVAAAAESKRLLSLRSQLLLSTLL
jgi:hypothetical protein